MSLRTLKLLVEYDGTDFAGWQVQDGQRTVQGVLQAAVEVMTCRPTLVRGASRTDAGVHALGQVAAFDTEGSIPAHGFLRGLNRYLPADVVVHGVEEVAPLWDPKRSSRGKRYRYAYWTRPSPSALDRRRAWHLPYSMDLKAMRAGAQAFVGTHDFEAFRASGCVAKHAVRTIYEVRIEAPTLHRVHFVVVGNAFVRNMVRIMAGTLEEVGRGKSPPSIVAQALQSRRRALAGRTAPAHGLFLEEVVHDERLPPRPADDVDWRGG
ncbi:MAG: tRNA pseudouridine(38-40) synthase TruA [Myxococcota bacterium]